MKTLPVAEAAAGEVDEAEADVLTLRAHLDDVTDSGRGEVAELCARSTSSTSTRRHEA